MGVWRVGVSGLEGWGLGFGGVEGRRVRAQSLGGLRYRAKGHEVLVLNSAPVVEELKKQSVQLRRVMYQPNVCRTSAFG